MDGGSDATSEALADIAYLARSENRVRVLDALSARAYPRRELEEETDTSRTTLSRMLNEFEERGWAERTTDGEYAATATGKLVDADFGRLVDSIETNRDLGDAATILPIDELSIGLHHFSDLVIHRNTNAAPDRIYDVWTENFRNSDTLQMVTAVGPTQSLDEAIHEEVVSGDMTTEFVCSATLIEHIVSPGRGYSTPEQVRERHEAGSRLYIYEGDIPCNLTIFDESVFISNLAADTAIETRNRTVRSWALDFFERYRADATQLTDEDIPG